MWPLSSVVGVIETFVAACTQGVSGVIERRVAIAAVAIVSKANFRLLRIPGQYFPAEARYTSAPTFPEPDGEFLPEWFDYRLAPAGEQSAKGE